MCVTETEGDELQITYAEDELLSAPGVHEYVADESEFRVAAAVFRIPRK